MFLRVLGVIALSAPFFGGKDPVSGGPWYHEKLTRAAAAFAGWVVGTGEDDDSTPAAALAWHADYVDSYLYNPLWWAAGGLPRFRSSLVHHDDLVKLHFDDLQSTRQIMLMWDRYRGGTVAGLMWAATRGDVAAARNIVGTGLHALQDFYSHSNWVDDPSRRDRTWTGSGPDDPAAPDPRVPLHLYTGAYEAPGGQAFKPHGKYSLDCSVMRRLLPADLMNLMCSGISPLSNTALCVRWRQCQDAQSPPGPVTVAGVTIPTGLIYLEPPGIALDSPWLSEIGFQQRDLPDRGSATAHSGPQMFDLALGLAGQESGNWLQQLERIMARAGLADFWTRVMTEPRVGLRQPPGPPELSDLLVTYDGDLVQYEEPARSPFAFLTAGSYPPHPSGSDEGWFLRLDISTVREQWAGTDADISAVVDGVAFPLDRMHGRHPGGGAGDWRLLEHNDFEAGQSDSYVVGPFASRPQRLALRSVSATGPDIARAAWADLVVVVGAVVDAVADVLLGILSGHADYVGTDKISWSWDQLERIAATGRTQFVLRIRGGDEGQFDLRGDVQAAPSGSGLSVTARLTSLFAVKESTWDRFTSDDEVFVVGVVSSPAAGLTIPWLTPEITGIDTGETHAMNLSATVHVPRYGGLVVPVQLWESDDEGVAGRLRIRDEFLRGYDQRTVTPRSNLVDAVGRAIAPDWKIGTVDAYAFLRGPATGVAHVVKNRPINQWLPGNRSLDIALDPDQTSWVRLDDDPPLPPPALDSPSDGARFGHFPRSTSLRWHPVAGASSYRVEVEYAWPSGTGITWSPQVVQETTATTFDFDFVGSQPGRWRVSALPGPGAVASAPSGWRHFDYSAGSALARPVPVDPADGARFTHFPRTTTLRWGPVPDATGYRVEVEYGWSLSGSITWSPLLSQAVSSSDHTFDFVGDQPGRWRVTALDAAAGHLDSVPSDWRSFSYGTPAVPPLGQPVPTAPGDGETFSHFPRTTTLRWNPVEGATDYDVEIEYGAQPDPNPWASWISATVQVPSMTFDFVGMQPGRWRVTARDATGARAASAPCPWTVFTYSV